MTTEESEDEWEWEDEEQPEKDAEGKAEITITGNLIKIDRSKVDWSSDEEDEDEEEPSVPAPPPPPPPPTMAPAPPPPPPPPGPNNLSSSKAEKLEQLKKRPTKRPDWNELLKEVEQFRYGFGGLLKKSMCNDRSQPILTTTKVKGVFVYDSEKDSKNADILKEIQRGAKLRHVKCNDRSKPNLRGIKSFKRQLTKEEQKESNFTFEDAFEDQEENEDVDKLRDDLESTKQLLELEVRSKQLLDKNNKKLQSEIDLLKNELAKYQNGISNSEVIAERKNSVKEKRRSIIRTISESGGSEGTEMNGVGPETPLPPELPEEAINEIEELKEEADEARRLAEEWENKYKEMQRQMEDLDGARKHLAVETNGVDDGGAAKSADNDENWLQNREIHQLQAKIRNAKDKKEFIEKERKFLNERLDNLKESIGQEIEARKRLRKEVREMNAAFRQEMAELEELEKLDEDLEDVYIEDDEDLVVNKYAEDNGITNGDETPEEEADEDEENITLEDVLRNADEMMEEGSDEGITLFFVAELEEDVDLATFGDDYDGQKEALNKRLEAHTEKIQLMRKSNFTLKSKIDILMDLLQVQKEKHLDLKQELNRMLLDIG